MADREPLAEHDPSVLRLKRREFQGALTAAVAGFLAPAGFAHAAADEEPAPVQARPPSQAALLLAGIVTQIPAAPWDEELLSRVLDDLRGDLARSRQLKMVSLTNSDDLATVFIAPPSAP